MGIQTNNLNTFDRFLNNSSKIKTPPPSLNGETLANTSCAIEAPLKQEVIATDKKREIKRPQVGVVDVPKISSMPLNDAVEIKKQENPYTKYKLSTNKVKMLNLQTIASVLIGACSVGSIVTLIKKIKK